MTKIHFKKLADAIATIKNGEDRRKVAHLVGNVCANQNKHFSWEIWCEICKCSLPENRKSIK